MTALAASLISSTSRPLLLRMRPDLAAHEQVYEGRRYWVIKDPLTLRYYRFQEEEFALLSMLDGQTSLDQIRKQFERQFAPQKLSAGELHQFLGVLYQSSLVISDAIGQATPLVARQEERATQNRREKWANVLSWRFRGVNPDYVLTWLDDHVGWLFSWPAICLALLLGLSALSLLLVEFDTFRARLPGFHEFFTWKNWFYLSLTLTITKVLHEFGHGLACKRLGGECHEMGLMLLVFSPCLYCNVSDAWTLPNKWQRAGIAAAGMYVELILASIATFVWWNTRPGLVHYLALDIMFVSSISTLLFNANPLLRFDGYYILSDLIEIPNLRAKATRILQAKLSSWMLGTRTAHDPFLPQRHQLLFALYAVAAACYGWLVTASIMWTLYHLLEPYGFKIVGQLLALVALYGLLARPAMQLIRFVTLPGRTERVNTSRAMFSTATVATVLMGLTFVPLPHYVTSSVLVQPRGATTVYVSVGGNVREVLTPAFAQVKQGQPILRLENVDLQLELSRLEAERAQTATRLQALRERAFVDDDAAQFLGHAEEALAAVEQQLARKQQDLRRLTVYAPASGMLSPAPTTKSDAAERGLLPNWSGHPLELRNVGAHLRSGIVLGQIGDPSALEAVLAIAEQDIDFVRPGQAVLVRLDELPGLRIDTKLETLSARELEIAPQALSHKSGGNVQTRTDASGHERPVNTTYQASAWLSSEPGQIVAGARGQARIFTGYETLGTRVWREIRRTLAWDM